MSDLLPSRPRQGSFLRWATITVPPTLLLGLASGRLSDSGYGNEWFDALSKPAIMPPGWVFGFAWSTLYIMTSLALALVLNARGVKGRSVAIALFIFQFALNLAWSPVFFAMHRIVLAFGLVLATLLWAAVTTVIFWKMRPLAGILMLPYLAWLGFASVLNWQIHQLNPNGVVILTQQGGSRVIIQ